MAQRYTTSQGETLKIPGGYPDLEVIQGSGGLAANGILFLLGEADGGPDWSLEKDLPSSWFGPGQNADVVAKFKSGRLVDAYLGACTPSGDERLKGSPDRIYLIKTNVSGRASATLPKIGGGTYHTLADRGYGEVGNWLFYTVTSKSAEVVPTTGTFTLLLPNNTTDLNFRVNGAAVVATQFAALATPATLQAQIDALAGVSCTGGANRSILTVAGTLAVAASGNQITVTRSVNWQNNPSVGDTLYIPSGSVIQGGTNKNRGSYVVTAVTNTTIVATKLLDDSGAAGQVTAPESIGAQAAAAITDVQAFAPVTITLEAGNVIDGAGKTLEINELTTSTGRLSDLCYTLNTTKVAWISKTGAPKMLSSASEYAVYLNVNRVFDNITDQVSAGGDIALKIGYTGTTAALTITATGLSTTVTGGAGANLNISFTGTTGPKTLSDLAQFINSQAGYSCSVGTATLGQKSPLGLDEVTALGICTTFGNQTGRVKIDASKFFDAVASTATTQLGTTIATNIPALAGLPDLVSTNIYLSGGTRGATTEAQFEAAIDALEGLRGNFIVPLISRDASADIASGETDSGSTYQIDAVNAYLKTHCTKMSKRKTRRHRQYFASKEDTFQNQMNASANLAFYRGAMFFQDPRYVQRGNGIVQGQPWYTAVLAAGMQAAAFSRGIVKKTPNTSGFIHRAGDFYQLKDDYVERALDAGLCPLRQDDADQWNFVSDQTMYTRDDNFYYNSIQAVYVGDIIALTTSKRMEDAFVGQNIADVSATVAVTAFKGIMDDLRTLKLIAPSDEAPGGWRNLNIRLVGKALIVRVEIFLAGLLYFIPIDFQVNQVSQSASA